MYAKPIIDIDIEISNYCAFNDIKKELENIGYLHEGNLGIKNREVFKRNGTSNNSILDTIYHHLYVCSTDSEELIRHLSFRDYLRENTDARDQYNSIKLDIIRKYGNENIEKYVESKENDYKEYFNQIINKAMDKYRKEKHPTTAST